MKKVRTRYAPSPTGDLHIGGARTALLSYLYAKHHHGAFIIRIEDTDVLRNKSDGENAQIKNLEWLGIVADESPHKPNSLFGPYRQSSKFQRYNKLIAKLIGQGLAYRAYDNSDELQKQRSEQKAKGIFSFRYDRTWLQLSKEEEDRRQSLNQFVVRLKLKKNYTYEWNDLVRGTIKVNTNDIGDFIILRENRQPTYNFAVTVDDYDMAISDVFRGEEHISNTPKQLAIYDALNWKAPRFGHLTIITNLEGKKLSKRDFGTTQMISRYKENGYSSDALFNFLALLGWSHPQAKEIMDRKTIIEAFDYKRLSKSPTKFDQKKLEWFCKSYMKKIPNHILIKQLAFGNRDQNWINHFISTYKKSAVSLKTLQNNLKIYEDQSILKTKKSLVVKVFRQELDKQSFTPRGINEAIMATSKITSLAGKNLYLPIRKATTNQIHGPELAMAIYLFGEKLIKARIN